MTTGEIAESVGKKDRAVRNWVRKAADKNSAIAAKIAASTSTYPADYNLDETCQIIEAGMGANAAAVYRASAQSPQVMTLEQTDDELDRAFKAAVSGIYAMLQQHDQRLSAVEGDIQQRKVLLPAPGKSSRAELNETVRRLAHEKCAGDFREAWKRLYKELYYRLHINVATRARNEGVKGMDVLEREGLLDTATSITVEMLA